MYGLDLSGRRVIPWWAASRAICGRHGRRHAAASRDFRPASWPRAPSRAAPPVSCSASPHASRSARSPASSMLRRRLWTHPADIATLATGAVYIGIALSCARPPRKIDRGSQLGVDEFARRFRLRRCNFFDDGAAGWFCALRLDSGALRAPGPDRALCLDAVSALCPGPRGLCGRLGPKEQPICGAFRSSVPKIAAFTLAGFFAGCGGLFLAIQTSSGNADIPQAGAYTLNSIALGRHRRTSLLGGTAVHRLDLRRP